MAFSDFLDVQLIARLWLLCFLQSYCWKYKKRKIGFEHIMVEPFEISKVHVFGKLLSHMFEHFEFGKIEILEL